jgi:two-component system LytT family response regulator
MSDPIRTVVADDEPLARRQMRALLERDAQIALVGEAGSGAEARRAIRELNPELLLLDVRMPRGDGFSVLEDLERKPYVIFATAHAEHALHAFDVEAVDYLLKPFDDERFERAIRRAKDAIRAKRLIELATSIATPAEVPHSNEGLGASRLTVHEGRRISWVNVADIEWIEAADYYAQVHSHGRAHLVRESLQKLEEKLGQRFLRVHRGALVNTSKVQRIDRAHEGGELAVVLQSGMRVTVSRSRRARVLKLLDAR